MHNLILCGFMGSGKTTVGKRLAGLLDWEYIDLDETVEQEQGLTIPQIFAERGEASFRDLEHKAVADLAKRIRCVVSTGGGALTYERNVRAVDRRDTVIFLDADFDTCYRRISASTRPLVRQNSYETLAALFEKRRAAYLEAAKIVADAHPLPETVAKAILGQLNLRID